jgi:hypothetical protein
MKYYFRNKFSLLSVIVIPPLILMSLALTVFTYEGKGFSIGIVTDYYRSNELDSALNILIVEIDTTIGSAGNIESKKENISYDNKDQLQAAFNYNKTIQNADFMLLISTERIQGVYKKGYFPVPTFGLGALDPKVQGIPDNNGNSGTSNFTYVWMMGGLESELKNFKEQVPNENLTILADYGTALSLQSVDGKNEVTLLENKLEASIQVLEIGDDISASLEKLNPVTDAVFNTNLGLRSSADIQEIANHSIEKKLPSFSNEKNDVYQGILASYSDDNRFDQLTRKLGVMVDEALGGAPLQEVEVQTVSYENLYINEGFAASTGFGVPLEVEFNTESIRMKDVFPAYPLEGVLGFAFNKNLDITISKPAIQNVKAARSAVLPNLDLALAGCHINSKSAYNTMIFIPCSTAFFWVQLQGI